MEIEHCWAHVSYPGGKWNGPGELAADEIGACVERGERGSTYTIGDKVWGRWSTLGFDVKYRIYYNSFNTPCTAKHFLIHGH